jgi:hypothetical protein
MTWIHVIVGDLHLSKTATVINIILSLHFLVKTQSKYIPEESGPDKNTRSLTPSLRHENLNYPGSIRLSCFHRIECPGSDSVKLFNSLSAKNSEPWDFPESQPNHLMCRNNGVCKVRAPKLSRSIETFHLDLSEALPCVYSPNRSSCLPKSIDVDIQSSTGIAPNKED